MTNRILSAIVLLLGFAFQVFGQGGATGAITGTVQDSTGAVVPAAEVKIVSGTTGNVVRTITTDSNGSFTVPLLPVGTYAIVVRAAGFAESKFLGIEVRVTETTRVTAPLQLKALKQEVEVSAEVAKVQTTNATTGRSLTGTTIRNLPLATQNFQQLLTLSAGTVSDLNRSGSLGRGDVRIEVNGQREGNNNYQIEGISASDYNVAELTTTPLPSPDAIQEFKVQTSLYDATQGRNGGGNINAILKTGTNAWHLDIFEFFRNDKLNANEFFLNREGQPKPSVKQNIFGGSAGGPLGRDGKFGYIFGNYQGTRQRSGLSAGTFVNTIVPVVPSDRSPQSLADAFFGGDTTQLDPVAVKLLNIKDNQFGGAGGGWLIPSLPQDASLGPGQARLNFSRPGKFDDNQITLNWDRGFRESKDRLSVRYFHSKFSSFLPFGAGGLTASFGAAVSPSDLNFPLDLPVRDTFASAAETHVFNPMLINEVRLGYVRIDSGIINTPLVSVSDLGIDRPNSNLDKNIYKFTLSNFQIGPAPFADITSVQNNFTLLDTLSYVRGGHGLRMGGEITHAQVNKNFPQVFNGQLFFAPGEGFSDFENFLRGAPFFSFGGSGVTDHKYRLNDFAFFAQDDFNPTRNLTLNMGLRLELFEPARDDLNHIGNLDESLARQGKNPFFFPRGVNRFKIPGLVGTSSESTFDNNFAINWAPRIGFAYDLFGHHTTSIRGGYGTFYAREDIGRIDQLSFSSPFLPVTFAAGPPGTMATLFATGGGTLPPGGVIDPAFVPVFSNFLGFVDNATGLPTTDTTQTPIFDGNSINLFGLEEPRHFNSPSTQQWNLSIERSLKGNWTLEATYIGTKGTHLRETRTPIQPFLVSPQNPLTITALDGTPFVITQNTVSNATARSRALGLAPSGFQIFANDADSNYNALQLTLAHQFSRGLYFQGAYTFSRSIDESSSDNTAFNTVFNDQTSLKATRGLSDFDRTHRWVFSYFYELPFFRKATGFRKEWLGGWAVSGISTFQSGTPFTIIDSAGMTAFTPPSPNLSTASLVPGASIQDALTSGPVETRLDAYVNVSVFQPAPVIGPDGATGFGNLGRNTYRGPFQTNWDFSLIKSFRITERQAVRFTADFFNLFNHASFASPAFVDISSPGNFGAITSTVGTPRLIQFSLRYSF